METFLSAQYSDAPAHSRYMNNQGRFLITPPSQSRRKENVVPERKLVLILSQIHYKEFENNEDVFESV